jgi:hypothetical protein
MLGSHWRFRLRRNRRDTRSIEIVNGSTMRSSVIDFDQARAVTSGLMYICTAECEDSPFVET